MRATPAESLMVPLTDFESLDDQECLACLGRVPFGLVAVFLRRTPTVFPAAYRVDGTDLLISVSETGVVRAMHRSMVGLQAQGWSKDRRRQWTVLVIGWGEQVTAHEEGCGSTEIPTVAGARGERFVVRLRPHVLTGRWIDAPWSGTQS